MPSTTSAAVEEKPNGVLIRGEVSVMAVSVALRRGARTLAVAGAARRRTRLQFARYRGENCSLDVERNICSL